MEIQGGHTPVMPRIRLCSY